MEATTQQLDRPPEAASPAQTFEQLPDGLPLPPVEPGYIRLYRGDAVGDAGLPFTDQAGSWHMSAEASGRWFTDVPTAAEGYAASRQADFPGAHRRQQFIDLPTETAATFNTPNIPIEEMQDANGGHAVSNEWLLPPELAQKAREYQVVHVEQLYEPGVEEDLTALLQSPQVGEYFSSVDPTTLPELVKDPRTAMDLLEQLSMGIGQGHLPELTAADRQQLDEDIHRLHIAVDVNHTQRLLGKQPAEVPQAAPNTPAVPASEEW